MKKILLFATVLCCIAEPVSAQWIDLFRKRSKEQQTETRRTETGQTEEQSRRKYALERMRQEEEQKKKQDKADMKLSCPDNNHPHIIDMGEAGHWACCNVGAKNPFDKGSFFSWAEIEPKDNYSKYEYKFKEDAQMAQFKTGIEGNAQYDVATAKWGDSWRTPTQEQIKNLTTKCKTKYKSVDGKNYMIFVAPNNNTIVLPCAGMRVESNAYYADAGYYWSSIPYMENSAFYMGLEMGGEATSSTFYARNIGMNIRPVYITEEDKKAEEAKKQKEAENAKMLAQKTAELKRTLPGKWKVTRLFNDAYNRCESGLAMTLQIKADGTYYATMTYTPPVTKQGVKLTFGVKGKWSVVNNGDVLLKWEERIINPQFTYSGNDIWTRRDIQRIQNSDESTKFFSARAVAENKLVGGLWIFCGDGGNLISDIKISGGQVHCNYWTGVSSGYGRAYDCIMRKIQ